MKHEKCTSLMKKSVIISRAQKLYANFLIQYLKKFTFSLKIKQLNDYKPVQLKCNVIWIYVKKICPTFV